MNNKSLTMMDNHQEHKCCRCKENPECELHTCPYSVEIHDDSESMCNCCSKCTQDCADDI